MFHNNICTIT